MKYVTLYIGVVTLVIFNKIHSQFHPRFLTSYISQGKLCHCIKVYQIFLIVALVDS